MSLQQIESADLVRGELQRILASTTFASAARSRRFLTYVVEQTLSGHPESVKELILGIEVFDRPTDFDPRTDTIVRVEAGKLRKRLQEYYDTEGVTSGIRIEIPKGTYIPQFQTGKLAPVPSPALRRRYAAGALGLVILATGAYWASRAVRGTARAATPSIAVLPFLNFSPDPSNDYIGDGLAEDLTDALAHVGGIRVASRTSAFSFKGRQADVHDIGAKLQVTFAVEGSVRKDGGRVKITAQLVRTDDGYHVWSRSFERNIRDIFAVQQEISESVASTLAQKLTGIQAARPARTHTANAEAFDLYLRGLHAARAAVLADIGPAERLFQQSIAADPEYARPYVALAKLYLYADIMGLLPIRELVSKARVAANKALALDSESADAHAVLGSLAARHDYNWVVAENRLRDALELEPNSATVHNDLAQNVLGPQGRWAEAMAENQRAIELDAFSPLFGVGRPWLLYLQRRDDLAIEGFRKLIVPGSPDTGILVGLASALAGKGDYAAAIDTMQQGQGIGNSAGMLAYIGYCHARLGHRAEAQRAIDEIESPARARFFSPGLLAVVYVGLGDHDRAFWYLERARESQDSILIFTRVDSLFDPIRSDPRFHTLLSEVGLTDEAILRNQELTSRIHR